MDEQSEKPPAVEPSGSLQPLPEAALGLFAQVAVQSPLVGTWIGGWLSAHNNTDLKVNLVIDAAHLEPAE